MRKVAILLSVACAACSATAMAAPASALDAPIIPATPTVGSEIKRGADAANRCSDLNQMPTEADGYINCIDASQSANRQSMAAGYDAFDVGLYSKAKRALDVSAKILSVREPEISAILYSKFKVYEIRYQQDLEKLHLTDDEAERAALIGR